MARAVHCLQASAGAPKRRAVLAVEETFFLIRLSLWQFSDFESQVIHIAAKTARRSSVQRPRVGTGRRARLLVQCRSAQMSLPSTRCS